jgi:hypothetical protein
MRAPFSVEELRDLYRYAVCVQFKTGPSMASTSAVWVDSEDDDKTRFGQVQRAAETHRFT